MKKYESAGAVFFDMLEGAIETAINSSVEGWEWRLVMAGRTGCYVCNYNGKEYVRKCLKSVLAQAEVNDSFQLYMVDNASTDGSVECVREDFGEKVNLLCNPVNLGGAGGFNTALKDAMKKGYDYVILLDNDIELGKGCISNFIQYMDAHEETGCAGAKIMIMDHPEYMQEFGVHLDFERYRLIHDYWYELDQGTEEVIESDCLASCALIIRTSCLESTNLFPEENFLYWDDLEFTYQIKLAGYRVVSLASCVAYHKGKKKPGTDTAPGYYGIRNRVKFFSKYEKEERLSQLCRNILEEYFQFFFGSASKGFQASNSSRMFALDDFVHKCYGKADSRKVFPMDEKDDRVKKITEGVDTVYVMLPETGNDALMEAVGALCRRLDEIDHVKRVVGVAEDYTENDAENNAENNTGTGNRVESFQEKLIRYYGRKLEVVSQVQKDVVIFRPCSHIKDVTEDIRPAVWVDKYLNCVGTWEDYQYVKAYPYLRDFFVDMHYEWLMQGILEERRR